MKHCINCQFEGKQVGQLPNGQLQTMIFCKNEECSDPVTGDPLPAQVARSNPAFCSITAKYFKQKEQDPPKAVVSLIQTE